MCMDTLAMDSMDMNPEEFPNTNASPVIPTGPPSKDLTNSDSCVDERPQRGKELENSVGSGGAEQTCYDDEGLMTDPGTPDSHGSPDTPGSPEELHDLIETKDMNLDMTENDLDEEKGYDENGLMTNLSTPDNPGTPRDEFSDDSHELDETKDANLDIIENDLGESGTDDDAQDTDPVTPQEGLPRYGDDPDETKDMNVDGAEKSFEMLDDGQDEGEKSFDGERFVPAFPITRVKRIIKLDKDVRLVSSDALALITQATALFVQSLSSASFKVMLQSKRKTIRGPDVILAAKSTRQFRECLENDLATLLEESNQDTANGEDIPVEKEHGTSGEPTRKRSQQPKSSKKQQLAPPGSRPITIFFKT
ncbi:uncharacterized protein [Physcomitrium patens]